MSKVYLYHNHEGRPVYRARKIVALNEARSISRGVDHVIEVTLVGVRSDLPKMILIEELLNRGNWGTGATYERIAAFRRGKTVKDQADEAEPELEDAA